MLVEVVNSTNHDNTMLRTVLCCWHAWFYLVLCDCKFNCNCVCAYFLVTFFWLVGLQCQGFYLITNDKLCLSVNEHITDEAHGVTSPFFTSTHPWFNSSSIIYCPLCTENNFWNQAIDTPLRNANLIQSIFQVHFLQGIPSLHITVLLVVMCCAVEQKPLPKHLDQHSSMQHFPAITYGKKYLK